MECSAEKKLQYKDTHTTMLRQFHDFSSILLTTHPCIWLNNFEMNLYFQGCCNPVRRRKAVENRGSTFTCQWLNIVLIRSFIRSSLIRICDQSLAHHFRRIIIDSAISCSNFFMYWRYLPKTYFHTWFCLKTSFQWVSILKKMVKN